MGYLHALGEATVFPEAGVPRSAPRIPSLRRSKLYCSFCATVPNTDLSRLSSDILFAVHSCRPESEYASLRKLRTSREHVQRFTAAKLGPSSDNIS